ncbi:MAG: hypothetical protein HZB18_12990 [Chloroflexi bacterium]|nr:hypothetical protein [Chloroflexota bacterium]
MTTNALSKSSSATPTRTVNPVRGLYARLTQDGVDTLLDKAKLHGERSRTILSGQD